jgi:mannose-6-phosphate isomerase-like protein (cupin superfamily)
VTEPNGAPVHRTAGEAITSSERREATILAALGEITITWYRLGPGERGPDPHVHHEHSDAFYVLDGELSFVLGPRQESVSVGAGGLVAAPPGFVHTFVNESGEEVRFLNIHAPDGGFAAYMRGRRDGDREATFDTFEPPADGGLPMSGGVVSGPGEGERLVRGNRVALLKCAIPDLFLAEFEVDGHLGGPDPHAHKAQVDSFYVLEGELELTVDGTRHVAGPETLASVPPGTLHAFAHAAPGRVRFLNLHTPDDGFGDHMRRVSD